MALLSLLSVTLGFAAPDDALCHSSITLGGATISVDHEPVAAPLPDLSQSGETRIPRETSFEVPVPLMWAGRLVTPGCYELSIVVTGDGELELGVAPLGNGLPQRLSLERADFARPAERIMFLLAKSRRGNHEEGVLSLSWGALFLQGRFLRIRESVSEAGGWQLLTYHFPADLDSPPELPLGTLTRRSGSPAKRALTLLLGDVPKLRVVDQDFLDRVKEQAALKRALAVQRRRLRREPASAKAIQLQMQALEGRLRSLGVEIQTARQAATLVIPGTPDANPGDASAGVTADLTAGFPDPVVRVSGFGGQYRFKLPSIP